MFIWNNFKGTEVPCLFNVGPFCLINKDSDTFQGRSQNLKGQVSKPVKSAQFILNYIY